MCFSCLPVHTPPSPGSPLHACWHTGPPPLRLKTQVKTKGCLGLQSPIPGCEDSEPRRQAWGPAPHLQALPGAHLREGVAPLSAAAGACEAAAAGPGAAFAAAAGNCACQPACRVGPPQLRGRQRRRRSLHRERHRMLRERLTTSTELDRCAGPCASRLPTGLIHCCMPHSRRAKDHNRKHTKTPTTPSPASPSPSGGA